METVVLLIMILLLRIKDTKNDISKEKYQKEFEKNFNKSEQSFTDKKYVLKTLTIESIIFSICYAFIWFKNYSLILNILSIIQIIAVFITINYTITDIIDTDNTKAIYHKYHILFNIILDYIYYPLSIFMIIFH